MNPIPQIILPQIITNDYPDKVEIQPLTKAVQAVIDVPGSKSITNRALILAAMAEGTSRLEGALDADDTQVMLNALQRLGIKAGWETAQELNNPDSNVTEEIDKKADLTIAVVGHGGHLPAAKADLFLGNSGTSMRFLTALCALGQGSYTLDGVERMRQRPQADLLEALQTLGTEAVALNGDGCPPLRVTGRNGLNGGTVRMNAAASSQFLTALLMAAPYARHDVRIEIVGDLRPHYVDITRQMMAQWGVETLSEGNSFVVRSGQHYAAQPAYRIEPDASSASYFFAIAALTGGSVTVRGLKANALQGDVRFATETLVAMGCKAEDTTEGLRVTGLPNGKLHGIDRDMSAISDTSLTLAALAPFADSPTTVRNIAHTRLQECDRIAAVCAELIKLGVRVDERVDGYTIYPAHSVRPAILKTYNDHRLAMSFALIGLKSPGIVIENPGCVSKTFPGYWQVLDRLR